MRLKPAAVRPPRCRFRPRNNLGRRAASGRPWGYRICGHRSGLVCPQTRGGLNRSTQHCVLKKRRSVAMERRFRRGFTAAEKTELWDRWKRGESLKAIGRAFGKPSSSIYFLVAPHGGIRPAERRCGRRRLKIGRCLAIGEAISCLDGTTATQRLWWSVI